MLHIGWVIFMDRRVPGHPAVHSQAVSPGGDSMSRYSAHVALQRSSWCRDEQCPKTCPQLGLSQLTALQAGCNKTSWIYLCLGVSTELPGACTDSLSSFSFQLIFPKCLCHASTKGCKTLKKNFSLKKRKWCFLKNCVVLKCLFDETSFWRVEREDLIYPHQQIPWCWNVTDTKAVACCYFFFL